MPQNERSELEPLPLGDVTHETFADAVGTSFRSDAYGPLRLAAVSVPEQGTRPGGRQPFSLTFVAETRRMEPQGVARLEHAALGVLEIFIVPTGPDRTGAMRYEAVFS